MYCDYRLEKLADKFCANLISQTKDPFDEDIVVAQSKTMEQYLNKKMADSNVIAANISYRFPRNSINDILKLCPESEAVTRLDKESMVWEIYSRLPEMIKDDKYPSLKQYLSEESNSPDFRRYQLAMQIAAVFDNYIGYRGDWLEKWQRNEKVTKTEKGNKDLNLGIHEDWQSDLWRQLTVDNSKNPVTFFRCSRLLKENITALRPKLPEKISIFGISNIPKDYIDFFALLNSVESNILDFYYLMPCIEYWGDLNRAKSILDGEGNRLLGCWGMIGRDFFELLLENDFDLSQPEEMNENFIPEPSSLFDGVKYDIINNNSIENSVIKKIPVEQIKSDNSIVVNSCYSRMREVEVLHDYILDILNKGKCGVSDIVVMAPKIEDYAPYIQAVFHEKENSVNGAPYIPYKLTDCSALYTSTEAETFMKILKLPDSKMTSEDLFEIISSEPVAGKFNLSYENIEIMHELISGTHIAWGKDGEQRKQILNFEYSDKNTWFFGFKRMLAGYAFDCEFTVDDGTLPYPVDIAKGIIIGKLIDICEKLFEISDRMKNSMVHEDWCRSVLFNIISVFFEKSGKVNENLIPLRQVIYSFREACNKGNLDQKLPLDVVRSAIENEFKSQGTARTQFFRGGVTFCQLLPMRNIPSKTICVIGLNDAEFPRINPQSGFDLATKELRRCDRLLRNEDRYIFLETLLACMKNIYFSYIGQSNANNEELAPSILLDELLDYLELCTGIKKEEFVTDHPLHGFDEKYFNLDSVNGKSRLFSYSKNYLKATKSFLEEKKSVDEFFCEKEIELSDRIPKEFSFHDFAAFFICPAQFFLENILNINLSDRSMEALKETEPFEINHLEYFKIKKKYLDHKILGKEYDIEKTVKADGMLPSGIRGDEIIESTDYITGLLHEEIKGAGLKRTDLQPLKLHFKFDNFEFSVSGSFNDIYEQGQFFFRNGKLKQIHTNQAWIWHYLALKAGIDIPATRFVGCDKDEIVEINIPTNPDLEKDELAELAEERINMLAEIFYSGLKKPIPLFLYSSRVFAQKITGKSALAEDEALKIAGGKWAASNDWSYEYDLIEEANYRCFGETFPPVNKNLKNEFIDFAKKIYIPMNSEVT